MKREIIIFRGTCREYYRVGEKGVKSIFYGKEIEINFDDGRMIVVSGFPYKLSDNPSK